MLLLHSEHNRDLAFLLICFVFCLFFFPSKGNDEYGRRSSSLEIVS